MNHVESRAFLQVPWLNGTVHRQDSDTPGWRPGQLEIRYEATNSDCCMPKCEQLRYNELNSTASYNELKANGFPLDTFRDEELLWIPDSYVNGNLEVGVEVVAAQANFIPGT